MWVFTEPVLAGEATVCSGCLEFLVFSPFVGIGVKVGNRRTILNYWVFVVMGIFVARCMSDEWGELTIPIISI